MCNRLSKLIQRPQRQQKGAVLILALIMLAVGAVIVIPLLSFMGSGFKTTDRVYNVKADELYAADAGVRNAMLRIQDGDVPVLSPDDPFTIKNIPVSYTIPSKDPTAFGGGAVYEITSTAGSTKIVADAVLVDFSKLFTENILTSPEDPDNPNNVHISNNVSVGGPLQVPDAEGFLDGDSGDPDPAHGFISSVLILNEGSNYTAPRIIIADPGGLNGGSGALVTPLFKDGKITGAIMNSGGDNYTGPIAVFTDPDETGFNAAATPILTGDVITEVRVTNQGYGYLSKHGGSGTFPVTFQGGFLDGAGSDPASASATVEGGKVTGVTVDWGGSGYTTPIVTIDDLGNRPAIVEAIIGEPGSSNNGKVIGFNVIDGGWGYVDPSTITVDITPPQKGGTTALAHVENVFGGQLRNESFVIDNAGSTYKHAQPPDVTVSNAPAGLGTGATGVATVDETEPGCFPNDLITNIWPSGEGNNPLQAFYQQQVGMDSNIQVIESNSVDLTTITGPAYIDGHGGTVTFTTNGMAFTLPNPTDHIDPYDPTSPLDNRLIYVNGSVVFNDCNLYLNSYTLFASSTDYNLAVKISNDSDVTGPGAIIAVGGIDFQPKLVNNQFIYLMSIEGRVRLAPMNDFVGSVAAQDVVVQSGDPNRTPSITWADPSQLDLNLPDDEVHGLLLVGFISWIINPETN